MKERVQKVEKALSKAQEIRDSIDDMVRVQEKAIYVSHGILPSSISSEENSSCEENSSSEEDSEMQCTLDVITAEMIKPLLEEAKYNYFDLLGRVEELVDLELRVDLPSYLIKFVKDSSLLNLSMENHDLFLQSYDAYSASIYDFYDDEREARSANGEIVSESDCESEASSYTSNSVMKRKLAAVHSWGRREKVKRISEQRFLARRRSKNQRNFLTRHPDIGEVIEKYVSDANVGADQWQRTGVLIRLMKTVTNKVTYSQIQKHLESIYGHHISYGTVVQRCIARNRRHRSAMRYKGVAKVTTRRARKGFTLRFNPDTHWSNAFYKGLNSIQYKDGRQIVNINRDDAAAFRLDTLATNKQHPTPVVKGRDVLTTRTDYVNRYPSTLQTTSYNFTGTDNT